MKPTFFIIIYTVNIIIPICLIISAHESNAKPVSTNDKQNLECKAETYDCTNDVHDQKDLAYEDKGECGSINKTCTLHGGPVEGYESPVFQQRFEVAKNGTCVLAGCCCSKYRRRDSTA